MGLCLYHSVCPCLGGHPIVWGRQCHLMPDAYPSDAQRPDLPVAVSCWTESPAGRGDDLCIIDAAPTAAINVILR